MKTIKTVFQYNKYPLEKSDMRMLMDIAKDCSTVKDYVYKRYSGIHSLSKLYPGYTVQNEMTDSGLRERLCLPSVYFYLAVHDAVGNIKSNWTIIKKKISENIKNNKCFSDEQKHYLRFVLKCDVIFEQILERKQVQIDNEAIRIKYEELKSKNDTPRLDNYLRRQVRKYSFIPSSRNIMEFSITERAYRYADHGIYISTKEKRKRIFIYLTDNNRYFCQMRICLIPEKGDVRICIPISVRVKEHNDYKSYIGAAIGMNIMFATSSGNLYGEKIGELHREYASWIRKMNLGYSRNMANNPGREKYNSQKNRRREYLRSYINMELNRMLREEKPERIYVLRLPPQAFHKADKEINNSMNMWQRGYINRRLKQKCIENKISLIEVLGSGISIECSSCGETGIKREGRFICERCGLNINERINTAKSIYNRGEKGKIIIR